MKTFSITDTGRLRNSNQDCVFCEENEVGGFSNLFLVADGMGGHQAGDLASRMCINEIVTQIRSMEARTPVSAFEKAIEAANTKVYEKSLEEASFSGMGTTLVGTMIEENTAYVVNIGDSRLYVLRDKLEQITVDHSLVEEMVQSGEIQKEEMRTHPNKNIITRALGTDTHVRPDYFEIKVDIGDVILLCSDGLTNMVEDTAIEETIRKYYDDMKLAGECLVRQANEAGGKDNISVILVRL